MSRVRTKAFGEGELGYVGKNFVIYTTDDEQEVCVDRRGTRVEAYVRGLL